MQTRQPQDAALTFRARLQHLKVLCVIFCQFLVAPTACKELLMGLLVTSSCSTSMKGRRYSVSSAHPHLYFRFHVTMIMRHARATFYSLLSNQISQNSSLGPKGLEFIFETIQGNRKCLTKNLSVNRRHLSFDFSWRNRARSPQIMRNKAEHNPRPD